MFKFLSREPLHDPLAPPVPGPTTEVQTTTCYMCACRCGIRVPLRHPRAPAQRRVALHSRASSARNATLHRKSTLRSATGIEAPNLVQKAMGMTAGSFNTREFFHGRTLAVLKQVKLGFIVLCFALPAFLALWGLYGGAARAWVLAALVQAPGLIAERWFFFAQAKHPQNLYYQVVS